MLVIASARKHAAFELSKVQFSAGIEHYTQKLRYSWYHRRILAIDFYSALSSMQRPILSDACDLDMRYTYFSSVALLRGQPGTRRAPSTAALLGRSGAPRQVHLPCNLVTLYVPTGSRGCATVAREETL